MCISNLYGEVIQLPKIIFKEAKANIVHLENLLEFDFWTYYLSILLVLR
jgi:hypothetical protein